MRYGLAWRRRLGPRLHARRSWRSSRSKPSKLAMPAQCRSPAPRESPGQLGCRAYGEALEELPDGRFRPPGGPRFHSIGHGLATRGGSIRPRRGPCSPPDTFGPAVSSPVGARAAAGAPEGQVPSLCRRSPVSRSPASRPPCAICHVSSPERVSARRPGPQRLRHERAVAQVGEHSSRRMA